MNRSSNDVEEEEETKEKDVWGMGDKWFVGENAGGEKMKRRLIQ